MRTVSAADVQNLDLFRAMFGSDLDVHKSDSGDRKRALWRCGCKAESIEIGEPRLTWWMLEWVCVGHRDALRRVLERRSGDRFNSLAG